MPDVSSPVGVDTWVTGDTFSEAAMTVASGSTVLLAVVAPASVPHLVTVAAGIAGPAGRVLAVTVVPSATNRQAVEAARITMAAVEDTASGMGTSIDTLVMAGSSPAVLVHEAAVSHHADMVVMGWRGSGNIATAFGSIIDQVVGRSQVPLIMVRPGAQMPTSLLLAFDSDQLNPAGRRGLLLAASVSHALGERYEWPLTLLQTGAEVSQDLPAEVARLTDRVHHDPRRRHEALAAVADHDQMVVVPVAPTIAGLRSATTRVNWAVADATLVVAVDVGPVAVQSEGLTEASDQPPIDLATRTGPARRGRHAMAVTAVAHERIDRRILQAALQVVGEVSGIRTWWAGADREPHLSLVVTVVAESGSDALGDVLAVLDTLPALAGARLRYDLVDTPTPLRVRELAPFGLLGDGG